MFFKIHLKNRKLWWLMGAATLLVLIGIIFVFPSLVFKWQMNQLKLDKVERIEYIEYEGAAFRSPIKVKKALHMEEDSKIFEQLLTEVKIGKRKNPDHISQEPKMVLFFYQDNGRVINAYIDGHLMGFNYGDNWLKVEKLDNIIDNMHLVERLEVKEGSI